MKGKIVFFIGILLLGIPPLLYWLYFGLYLDLKLSESPEDWQLFASYYSGIAQAYAIPVGLYQINRWLLEKKEQKISEELKELRYLIDPSLQGNRSPAVQDALIGNVFCRLIFMLVENKDQEHIIKNFVHQNSKALSRYKRIFENTHGNKMKNYRSAESQIYSWCRI